MPGAEVTSDLDPVDGGAGVLTSVTAAVERNGIGHQALYQPPGAASMANISERTVRSPSPPPKNSPTGLSTVVRPSKVIRSRRPASVGAPAAASGTRSRSAVIARGPVRAARADTCPRAGAVTVARVVEAPGCAGFGSRVPAARSRATTSAAGSAGSNRDTPAASAKVR